MSGKVLVTGASGLAGANLVRMLLEQGRDVRLMLHADKRAFVGLDVETVSADVSDLPGLERALDGVEVVYHLAASISLEMDSGPNVMAVNTLGTHNVVAACLMCGVRRLIHFSSIEAVCQDPLDQPMDENRPLVGSDHPTPGRTHISPYALSKAQGEREVLDGIVSGLDAVILRPTAMLGPYDYKPSYLGQALIQLAKGSIPALVSGGFDWVDVRDVVAAAIHAEQVAPAGSVFQLGGHWQTVRQVAQLVAAFTCRAAPRATVPLWLADAFAPVMLKLAHFNGSQPIYTRVALNALRGNRQVSSARAMHELGYTARPLAETVRDTLAWFEQHGFLGKNTHDPG